MMSCKIGNKEYFFKNIDFLNTATKNIEYAAINPTGHIPLIEEG